MIIRKVSVNFSCRKSEWNIGESVEKDRDIHVESNVWSTAQK